MGEARRRRETQAQLIYHHTSTLRSNLLWMSGQINVEGKSALPAFHPKLGEVNTDPFFRRAMEDFPPVVWLTRQIGVPACLQQMGIYFINNHTGEQQRFDGGAGIANAIALQRLALGFRIEDINAVPWPEYHGYHSDEGAELNESAREVGDDPDQWFVSEKPVDLMKMVEIRASKNIMNPKLERVDGYLADVKKMVQLCRATEGAFIPPSWLKPEEAKQLARKLGVPAHDPRTAKLEA